MFSVNNSLDYEGTFAEIVSKEAELEAANEEASTTRSTRSLRKKLSSSSILLKHPNAKRRRTEKTSTTLNESLKESTTTTSIASESELWTEKYQFKDASDIVTNKAQLERLKEWLNNWKSKHATRDPNNNSNSKSSGDDGDSDYSCSSESSSDDSSSSSSAKGTKGKSFYQNAIILVGPHGSGKTSSVYAVAKELGFKVNIYERIQSLGFVIIIVIILNKF